MTVFEMMHRSLFSQRWSQGPSCFGRFGVDDPGPLPTPRDRWMWCKRNDSCMGTIGCGRADSAAGCSFLVHDSFRDRTFLWYIFGCILHRGWLLAPIYILLIVPIPCNFCVAGAERSKWIRGWAEGLRGRRGWGAEVMACHQVSQGSQCKIWRTWNLPGHRTPICLRGQLLFWCEWGRAKMRVAWLNHRKTSYMNCIWMILNEKMNENNMILNNIYIYIYWIYVKSKKGERHWHRNIVTSWSLLFAGSEDVLGAETWDILGRFLWGFAAHRSIIFILIHWGNLEHSSLKFSIKCSRDFQITFGKSWKLVFFLQDHMKFEWRVGQGNHTCLSNIGCHAWRFSTGVRCPKFQRFAKVKRVEEVEVEEAAGSGKHMGLSENVGLIFPIIAS